MSHKLESDFGFSPIVACEIEFTLHGSDQRDLAAFWREVTDRAERDDIGIFKIEKERGLEQHEISLNPARAEKATEDIVRIKDIIAKAATLNGMKADFSAKPFTNQPGNGLHVHVHLEDYTGRNVFYKDDVMISDALKYSIGGLLYWLPTHMTVFAPKPESYDRFHYAGAHTPTTVSWGANNRTVAVRLPDARPHNKHIEHRVPGADADPKQTIELILDAMCWGIANKADPGEQIYGDANLEMYHLPRLPLTWEDASAQAQPKALSQS